MQRKAVVFGAGGQLGVELVKELRIRHYSVTAWDRASVDISDAAAVQSALNRCGAEVVFNAAAYNLVDVAEKEPETAFQVNALAVRNLAVACSQVNAWLVHYSTDYVFDGTSGVPYIEEDATHPLGAYAVSKLAGELYARAYLEKVLVVRTSGVFGPGGLNVARSNFVETMLRLAAGSKPIRVVSDFFASPTYAPLLAARSIDLFDHQLSGVFHMGGGSPISWYEFARIIFEVAGLTPDLQATNETEYKTAARRPKFSSLSNAKMEAAGLAPMPPIREAIESYFALRKQKFSETPV